MKNKYLYDKIQKYIDERSIQDEVCINADILGQVVMDYFTDIYRLKQFHGIEHVNITKIISYEVFWILRRKPIQIKTETTDDKLKFVNEGFLTTFIGHELLLPDEKIPLSKTKETYYLNYLKHIYYHLKYRNVDKQCLELMMFSFETGKNIYGVEER